MNRERSLVIGASGQIGIELLLALKARDGAENVVGSDIRPPEHPELQDLTFEHLNVLNADEVERILVRHRIDTVYNLAALLSATAEKYPEKGWDLNMNGLFNILNPARRGLVKKVFWPSSIAVFGPTTPKNHTPQQTICEPSTVYGISKLAGERWCEYYHQQYGVDVRSLRFPGLIGHRSVPGGGTTDYAVHIYYEALEKGQYTSFLSAETRLPMMYIEDAIRATLELMEAPSEQIKVRSSYNLQGIDFTPEELATSIQRKLPDFTIGYAPDFRQAIADGWPSSIDDTAARTDWGWKESYDLDRMTDVMLDEIGKKRAINETER